MNKNRMTQMKKILLILFAMLSLTASAAQKVVVPAIRVTDLRAERLVNPMSLDTPTPRLGWRLESTKRDVKQTA